MQSIIVYWLAMQKKLFIQFLTFSAVLVIGGYSLIQLLVATHFVALGITAIIWFIFLKQYKIHIKYKIVAILSALCISSLAGYLNSRNVCLTKLRPLTEKEMVLSFVEYTNLPRDILLQVPSSSGNYIKAKYLPYKTQNEFLKNNPECCRVSLNGMYTPNPVLESLLGMRAATITGSYKLRFQLPDSKIITRKITLNGDTAMAPIVSNCGKILFGH